MTLYAVTIILGAGLLFLVQPIVARYLIPWYGGGAAVWTTCMLFFQCELLAGYGYAHFVGTRLDVKKQAIAHLLLIAGSLFFLPVIPSEGWRPEDPNHPVRGILTVLSMTLGLTYLTVSTTAPLLQHWLGRTHPGFSFFMGYWEFPLTLVFIFVLSALCHLRDDELRKTYHWMAGIWILVLFFGAHIYDGLKDALVVERNFYGVLRVIERDRDNIGWRRYLWHGGICHGSQFLHETRRREPAMYYTSEAGISITVENHPKRRSGEALRVGVLGLGTGTLAAYGRQGDMIRFYEINPGVVRLAQEYFSYLDDSAAKIELVLGDGRIALGRELREQGSQKFDILAVDAFSGDAIPVHLLTREAFALYWEHLADDGVLAVHVSNLYVDLRPVVRGLAGERNLPAVLIGSAGDLEKEIYATDWVLITENGSFLANPEVVSSFTPWMGASTETVLWTDDYSNLFRVLKTLQ